MYYIETWLHLFKTYWNNHNIDGVISLFSENCEYWENPFTNIQSKENLRNEWKYILRQNDIKFEYSIFSKEEDTFVVKWSLSYTLEEGEFKEWAGVYLMRLDYDNKCSYFYQCGELKY